MAVFYNQATLVYNNNRVDSNVVSGELVQVLAAQKNALYGEYNASDAITYVISIVNSGAVAFNNLVLSDDLGAFTFNSQTITPLEYIDGSLSFYVNGVLSATPTVSAGPPLVISGVNVPAGSNALIIYQARAGATAPLASGSTITNTVTINGAGLSAPIEASSTITVSDEAFLSINKSLSPSTVSENEPLTYTFVIQNSGNTAAVATDNVTLTDTFDPILSGVTVTLDGVALTEGIDYTYNATTGEFATTQGRITVPAATITTDPVTAVTLVTPGVAVLKVTGTV